MDNPTPEQRAEWLIDSSFRHIVPIKDDQQFIAEKIVEEIRAAQSKPALQGIDRADMLT